MTIVDSHCHLDSYERAGNLSAVLQRAHDMQVEQLIAIGTELEDWAFNHRMAKTYPYIHYTVGLHPCYVKEDWESHVMALSPYFTNELAPVALGEIGLDYYHLPKFPDEAAESVTRQKEAFRQQLLIADQMDVPIVIHSREAFADTVSILDESDIDWQKVVFHCFSYGVEEIEQIYARGGRASFTGIITYKSAENVRQAALAQGIEKLMIETDCPYLAPVPERGKENEPGFLRYIAEYCAELFGMSYAEFAQQTTANTTNFFALPPLVTRKPAS